MHITVAYRMYDDNHLELFVEDGKEEVFRIPHYDTEDDEGF